MNNVHEELFKNRIINQYNWDGNKVSVIHHWIEDFQIKSREETREKILNGEIKNFRDFFEKKKILDEKNDQVEVLNFDDIFENDLKIFKKNFNKFNKVVNENFEKISKDKKENLTKEIEVLNRKIEKILKEFN